MDSEEEKLDVINTDIDNRYVLESEILCEKVFREKLLLGCTLIELIYRNIS